MNSRYSFVFLFLWTINAFSQPAFPYAEGFGATASGGRGGKVIYVTNLNVSGPGSLAEALATEGPRYILFTVSGVIPGTIAVPPGRGDFTLAGQTSPGGITVRGFEMYNGSDPSVSNIIIRHLRSRIGDREKFPTPHWLADDGITIGGVREAIIDHCSFAHAGDEAVDISRSSRLTIQNCLLAETLGGHAYLGGMLINYSDATSRLDSLTIHHNTWNRIGGRMPEISCETPYCNGKTIHVELSNNLFWDPQVELWYEGNTGAGGTFYVDMVAINNAAVARSTYGNGMFHHDLLHFPQNRLYFSGNKLNLYNHLKDYDLFYCCNDFPTSFPNTDLGVAALQSERPPFPPVSYTMTDNVQSYMASHVGAFPRDAMDKRLTRYLSENVIIGLPVDQAAADDAFVLNAPANAPTDSDLDGMPDYWEISHNLNPAVQDHNGTEWSVNITGMAGYTNLECYINCLSDALVHGYTSDACGITGFMTANREEEADNEIIHIVPNPAGETFSILSDHGMQDGYFDVTLYISSGLVQKKWEGTSMGELLDIKDLAPGLYIAQIKSREQTTRPVFARLIKQ